MYKFIFVRCFLLILLFNLTGVFANSLDNQKCMAFVKHEENHNLVHENEFCIEAAKGGYSHAQYLVGLSYGFSGDNRNEEKYYRMAVNKGEVAAYLALGHVVRSENLWEAIYWYQKYVETKADGYGYAAIKIARIFDEMGDHNEAEYWIGICKTSSYTGCEYKNKN